MPQVQALVRSSFVAKMDTTLRRAASWTSRRMRRRGFESPPTAMASPRRRSSSDDRMPPPRVRKFFYMHAVTGASRLIRKKNQHQVKFFGIGQILD